ncbi:MAG: sensor histidine kinase [Bradymonadaceae bacterium]
MNLEIGSFRTRAVILAVLIALAPLAFVYLGPLYENIVQQRMQNSLWEGAEAAIDAVASQDGGTLPEERLEEIAREHEVWVRVTDHRGQVEYASNHALSGEVYKSWVRQLLGERPPEVNLRDYDAGRPALTERPEFERARRRGRATQCELVQEGRLLICLEVRRIPPKGDRGPMFVYLQTASVRGVRELAGATYPMFQLVVQLLAVALVFALLVGWWSVRPVQRLREQVVDRADPPVSTEQVDVCAGGEVKRLEAAFNRLLEALQERREATKSYMADIAHEVKNPVAAIQTAAGRLDTDDLDADRVDRIRRVLEDSSERLDRLVSRFLELARAEAGLPEESREIFEVGDLVERLVDRLRRDERFADIEFAFEGQSLAIEAAPGHLEAAVGNLLENGASFAESRVEVRLETVDGDVVLSVADDGPGIDEEDLPHVFDRFFSRRPGNEGTGLGLAMTRAVVEAHEGDIEVESEVGEGTTFRIRVPKKA